MDQMIEAQTRSAQHDQAMMQLAELRDQELQLRSQESELLRVLAQAETQLQQAQQQAQQQAPMLQVAASSQVLPPTYRSGSAGDHQRSTADDCEWALIERVAQQRAISFLGSIPLLIDSLPSDPLAQHKIIERAREMSAIVQMVILSENQWLFDQAHSGSFAATAIQF
jgi:multidrug efflux pump subunit AcrA (membrane-fusion protein)